MTTTDKLASSSDAASSFTHESRPCSSRFQPLEAGALLCSLNAAVKGKEEAEQQLSEMSKENMALQGCIQELTQAAALQAATSAELAGSNAALEEEAANLRRRVTQLNEVLQQQGTQAHQQASAAVALKAMFASVCKESSEASKEVERLGAEVHRLLKAQGARAGPPMVPAALLVERAASLEGEISELRGQVTQLQGQASASDAAAERAREELSVACSALQALAEQQRSEESAVRMTAGGSRLHGESQCSTRPVRVANNIAISSPSSGEQPPSSSPPTLGQRC